MMKRNSLGLYIHIPFCVEKCLYCDFLSFAHQEHAFGPYFEALNREIRAVSREAKGMVVDTIFIGGGTPSIVDVDLMEGMMKTLSESFLLDGDCEITMEMNPGTLTEEKARGYRAMGINRASMGVQSFDDGILAKIGRIHSASDAVQGYELLRKAGFTNINMDLMQDLPGESENTLLNSLGKAVDMGPEHISLYSLIVEPGTPMETIFHEHPELFSDEDTERDRYYEARDFLESHGYKQYEISNYSREGFHSRHNLKYWSLMPYLGLGLGAHSYFNGMRFNNTESLENYLSGKGVHINSRTIGLQEAMEDFIIFGLRKLEGISCSDFEERFGVSIESKYDYPLMKNIKGGLLEKVDDFYRLTLRGMDLLNLVQIDFI